MSWPTSHSKELVWIGETIVGMGQGDESDYGMSLRIPPLMNVEHAIEQAPVIYAEMDKARSGTTLLRLLERHLERIAGEEMFAKWWSDGLSIYKDLQPERLQMLARGIVAFGVDYPRESAAISIMAYVLLGLAEDRKIANPVKDCNCVWCPLTALPTSKYCKTHKISRKQRRKRTKKERSADNLDVVRRHACRISKIADDLWKNEQGIYNKLFRQLVGMTGGLNTCPPPLETVEDNEFATGARIGTNGAEWFIYLWKVLPRMRKVLGADWPALVRSALEWKEWSRVIQRLRKIDSKKDVTDAFKWALTLIEAEEWAEAREIERRQRRRGRPPKSKPGPDVEHALRQVRDGKRVTKVAEEIGVPKTTLYRWRARMDTTSAVATESR